MSLYRVLKAINGNRRIPWSTCNNYDFKKYYEKFHRNKTRWMVSKEDPAFYNALNERELLDILPKPLYEIKDKEKLKHFAKKYVSTIEPVEKLIKKYEINEKYYKNGHLNRLLKNAVKIGAIKKGQLEKAVERRQFLNLIGKYFNIQDKALLYKIADKGFAHIKVLRKRLADRVKENYEKNSPEFLQRNSFLASIYGNSLYRRKVGDDCVSETLSKFLKPKKIQKIRQAEIAKLIKRKK